jgi:hypothetical protein
MIIAIPSHLWRRSLSVMAKARRKKNPAAVALGRLGGRVMTEAKREANRVRAKKRWAVYAATIAKAKAT